MEELHTNPHHSVMGVWFARVKRQWMMQGAATTMQAVFRGYFVREYGPYSEFLSAQRVKRLRAIELMQRCARRLIAQQLYRQQQKLMLQRRSAVNIQRVWRGIWGRERFAARKQEFEEEIAAAKLQIYARAYFARKRKQWAKERAAYAKACNMIQRCFWRRRARARSKKRAYLQRMGSCHSCCSRRPSFYMEFTEQPLCVPCLMQTKEELTKREGRAYVWEELGYRVLTWAQYQDGSMAASRIQRQWRKWELAMADPDVDGTCHNSGCTRAIKMINFTIDHRYCYVCHLLVKQVPAMKDHRWQVSLVEEERGGGGGGRPNASDLTPFPLMPRCSNHSSSTSFHIMNLAPHPLSPPTSQDAETVPH